MNREGKKSPFKGEGKDQKKYQSGQESDNESADQHRCSFNMVLLAGVNKCQHQEKYYKKQKGNGPQPGIEFRKKIQRKGGRRSQREGSCHPYRRPDEH